MFKAKPKIITPTVEVAPPRSLTACSSLPPEGATPPAVWRSQSRGSAGEDNSRDMLTPEA